jgi:hypothetical protein
MNYNYTLEMVKGRLAIPDQSSDLALVVGRFILLTAKKEQKGGRQSAALMHTRMHNFRRNQRSKRRKDKSIRPLGNTMTSVL